MGGKPFAVLTLIFLGFNLTQRGLAQLMREQAQHAIQRPAKVDVLPADQANQTGQPIRVQVVLRSSAGQPIAAQEATIVEVTATQPSGQVVKQAVTFAPGEATKSTQLAVSEAGVTKLGVREVSDHLLGSTNYVAVSKSIRQPAARTKSSKRTSKIRRQSLETAGPESATERPHLKRIALAYQTPSEPAAFPNVAMPQLMLKVSGENDAEGVRADGVAFARVQVFYMGPEPPQKDIEVWVQSSDGDISANPIVIPKNQLMGESHWTSKAPVTAAKLKIAATNPPDLPFAGSSEATVVFGAPILGIGFVNPPSKITIVDSVTLTAVFFDAAGNPVKTGTKREYSFVSNSPVLSLRPEHAQVEPGTAAFSTVAIPTFVGESQIEAFTPGYQPVAQKVRVTGLGVLLLCVAGGILGGVLAYMNSQGKLWARIVAGVIVGAVASWAYVFIGLPSIQAPILHTQISVLFVSILAAFSGVKALSAITKTLKFGF